MHNAIQADQIQQFVPWTNLAWHQVHSGQLPLWNPYNVLGMPLAFNWQSGVFSVPVLVGYLFPVSFAVSPPSCWPSSSSPGPGVYVLCRVLGLGPLSAAFGGHRLRAVGPDGRPRRMAPHLGDVLGGMDRSPASCSCCGESGDSSVAVLVALSTAFAIYGGHPESLIVTALASVVFLVVY